VGRVQAEPRRDHRGPSAMVLAGWEWRPEMRKRRSASWSRQARRDAERSRPPPVCLGPYPGWPSRLGPCPFSLLIARRQDGHTAGAATERAAPGRLLQRGAFVRVEDRPNLSGVVRHDMWPEIRTKLIVHLTCPLGSGLVALTPKQRRHGSCEWHRRAVIGRPDKPDVMPRQRSRGRTPTCTPFSLPVSLDDTTELRTRQARHPRSPARIEVGDLE
jgi:hypothetical protein